MSQALVIVYLLYIVRIVHFVHFVHCDALRVVMLAS